MDRVRVRGKGEIKALTDQVFAALQHADLSDELAQLHARVFSLDPEELFDTVLIANESVWTLKPMVELVLLHVRDVAMSTRPVEERQHEIRWALEMAGF